MLGRAGDQGAVDARLGVLSGSVDVGHHHQVGRGQGPPEVGREQPGPRVQVGLEHGHAACRGPGWPRPGPPPPRRVVGVVVDHRDPAGFGPQVKAPGRAREPGQGGRRGLERCSGGRAAAIAPGRWTLWRPGTTRVSSPRRPPAASTVKPHPGVEGQDLAPDLGPGGEPVGDHLAAGGLGQAEGAGVVGAEHRRAVGREPSDEGPEGGRHRRQVAPVVEVVGLDVGDHGDRRGQLQERAVGLVGLGHEVGAAAGGGVDPAGLKSPPTA